MSCWNHAGLEIIPNIFVPRGTAWLIAPAERKVVLHPEDAKLSAEEIGRLKVVKVMLPEVPDFRSKFSDQMLDMHAKAVEEIASFCWLDLSCLKSIKPEKI